MEELLSRSFYRKDLETLLTPGSPFQVRWNDAEVRLEYYYQVPDPQRPLQGICYELTYQVGTLLRRLFEGQYLFMAADGNCPGFFSGQDTNHTFIVAVPWIAVDSLIAYLQSGQEGFPPMAYLVDPSFRRQGESGKHPALAHYRIKAVYDFEAISPQKDGCERFPFQHSGTGEQITHTLPLGLAGLILPPELIENPDQLLVFGFRREAADKNEVPCLLLGTKEPDADYPVIRPDLATALPETHLLRQFIGKVQVALSQPDSRELDSPN